MSSKWYGSLNNRVAESCKQPKPEVGMGVTEMLWSDRYPYEVVDVLDDRHILVRRLDYKRIDNNGMSESQEYEYTSNENNSIIKLFLTKQNRWREQTGRKLGCNTFVIGYAERYYDFSF